MLKQPRCQRELGVLPSYSTVTCDFASGRRYGISVDVLLADIGETPDELMREHDRHRHELGSFVAGVTEHHSLVAGAAGIDAAGNIRRL